MTPPGALKLSASTAITSRSPALGAGRRFEDDPLNPRDAVLGTGRGSTGPPGH